MCNCCAWFILKHAILYLSGCSPNITQTHAKGLKEVHELKYREQSHDTCVREFELKNQIRICSSFNNPAAFNYKLRSSKVTHDHC